MDIQEFDTKIAQLRTQLNAQASSGAQRTVLTNLENRIQKLTIQRAKLATPGIIQSITGEAAGSTGKSKAKHQGQKGKLNQQGQKAKHQGQKAKHQGAKTAIKHQGQKAKHAHKANTAQQGPKAKQLAAGKQKANQSKIGKGKQKKQQAPIAVAEVPAAIVVPTQITPAPAAVIKTND